MTDTPKSTTKIVINGQEISADQVPEMLRGFVKDSDGNGIPDVLDHLFKNPLFSKILDGNMEQLKAKLHELSPEQQAKIGHLIEKLTAMSGSSDLPSSFSVTTVSTETPVIATSSSTSSSPSSINFTPSGTPQIDYAKLGIPDPDQKSSFSPAVIAAVILLAAVALAGLWLLKGRI